MLEPLSVKREKLTDTVADQRITLNCESNLSSEQKLPAARDPASRFLDECTKRYGSARAYMSGHMESVMRHVRRNEDP